MLIKGMQGLGDNIYQRAVLKQLQGDVWLQTSWPQLYRDLPNVHPVAPITNLRTQQRNALAFGGYTRPPAGTQQVQIQYGDTGILQGLSRCLGLPVPEQLDLPDFGAPPLDVGPYVVVRPATVRKEWRADSRNPRPEYLAQAAQAAKAAGYTVVSVADLAPGQEWLVGEPPPADVVLHAGELSVGQLLALTQHARGLIGGVGWIYPAAMAQGTPLLCFFGGFGHYNHPDKLGTAPNITNALPAGQCRCKQGRHACAPESKVIDDADEIIARYVSQLQAADLVARAGHGGAGRPGRAL